jgi:hypothetical protein
MTIQDILALRLHNQQLSRHQFIEPADVVRNLGAMQAQDFLGAMWSVGTRLPIATEKTVEAAINDGKIVRSWPMRGTLHFMAPEDLRWMVQLMAPRIVKKMAGPHRRMGLDDEAFTKSRKIITSNLKGGKQYTRVEMTEILQAHGIDTSDQKAYHIMIHAAMLGDVCIGPRKGKQPTFVLVDEWVPPAAELTPEQSLAQMVERYFTGHGPATIKDFMWWTGLTATETRAGIVLAGPKLASQVIEGTEYWMSPSVIDNIPPHNGEALLLPGFDEYMLGYTDRSLQLGPSSPYIKPKNGVFDSTIVVNGNVVGVWRRTLKAREVIIELTFFQKLTSDQETSVRQKAEQYAAFVGLTPNITL